MYYYVMLYITLNDKYNQTSKNGKKEKYNLKSKLTNEPNYTAYNYPNHTVWKNSNKELIQIT